MFFRLKRDAPGAQETQWVFVAVPTRRPAASFWRDRRGASAIVLALSLSAVLGATGLAVDAGLWYNDKRTLQGVADLAAWTGAQTYASELQTSGTTTSTAKSDARNAAQAVAAANGVKTGVNGVTVTINSPAASGPNSGTAGTFEVIVRKSENLFFSSSYLHTVTVASRAVSEYTTVVTGVGSPGCILALNNLVVSHGAKVTSGNLTTSGCGIDVNGTSTSAFTVANGGQVTIDSLNVVGGTSTANGSHLQVNGADTPNGGTVTADPYASITLANAESAAPGKGCPNNNSTSVSGGSKGASINPGYYCGGLNLSGNVTLNPGVYVVNGGTFSVADGARASATSGVTIVLTGNSTVDINSGGELDITAPTTGSTAGLVFYGDPANTGTMTFSDGSRVSANGAFYFPAATVYFASGSGTTSTATVYCAQLVGYNITLAPGGSYTLDDTNCATYGVQQIGGTTTKNAIKMVE